MASIKGLKDFIIESNKIEGIKGYSEIDIVAHKQLLELSSLTRPDIENFVYSIANASIRNKPGMNVSVGKHIPLPGGPDIPKYLDNLLNIINRTHSYYSNSYENHIAYEKLHPFMDGNGRSGRVIWAWQMKHEGYNPFYLGFLHNFYYQSLSHSR